MFYLTTDIKGESSKILYAKKGDTVTIIADHGNIVIAEKDDGKRLPVQKVFLSENKIEPDIEIVKKKR